MVEHILPDTDVLVDFLRGDARAVALVRSNVKKIILSTIVIAELYAGVKDGKEKLVLDDFVAMFRIIPVTQQIAISGGLYRRDFGRSHHIGLADAILAATADAMNAEIKTLNIKHYPMFKKLKPAYKK